jgi:hypothetical protein
MPSTAAKGTKPFRKTPAIDPAQSPLGFSLYTWHRLNRMEEPVLFNRVFDVSSQLSSA